MSGQRLGIGNAVLAQIMKRSGHRNHSEGQSQDRTPEGQDEPNDQQDAGGLAHDPENARGWWRGKNLLRLGVSYRAGENVQSLKYPLSIYLSSHL
jgi:hypothetical protein